MLIRPILQTDQIHRALLQRSAVYIIGLAHIAGSVAWLGDLRWIAAHGLQAAQQSQTQKWAKAPMGTRLVKTQASKCVASCSPSYYYSSL